MHLVYGYDVLDSLRDPSVARNNGHGSDVDQASEYRSNRRHVLSGRSVITVLGFLPR